MISIKKLPRAPEAEQREGGRAPSGEHSELRCGCGSLLAKLVSGSVELKCRRCKQVWTIPLDPG